MKMASTTKDEEPARKPISLTLEYSHLIKKYTVKEISNTTQYKPGDWLDTDTVQQLCHFAWTTVTMREVAAPSLPLPIPPIPIP